MKKVWESIKGGLKKVWKKLKKVKFNRKTVSLIVHGAIILACVIFLFVSGIFSGIFETFGLIRDAGEDLRDFKAAIQNTVSNIKDGNFSGLFGGVMGGDDEHDPGKNYNTEVLLCETFDAHAETLDVAHLNYTSDELRVEVERCLFSNPRYFYVSNSYEILYQADGETVSAVSFTYLYDADTVEEMNAELDELLAPVFAGAPTSGDNFDDVLYFHDYLVKNYSYDYSDLPEEERIRDAYRFFTEGHGVCQGYMQAMTLLCQGRGIESIPVVSEPMDHAWNLVKVNGEWYHVDVTWDDAGGETSEVYPSYNSYRYFLLSDAAIQADGHTGYRTWERADDETYDNALWRASKTSMVRVGDVYYASYYKKDGTLGDASNPHGTQLICGRAAQMEAICDLGGICWYENAGKTACYQSAFLSLVEKGGYLYFNTNTAICRYNPATGEIRTIADLASTLGNNQIFGIAAVHGSTLSLVVAEKPQGAYTVMAYTLP